MNNSSFYIVSVKTGSDFAAVESLRNKGMVAFSVAADRRVRHRRSKKTDIVKYPVLGGYCFVTTDSVDFLKMAEIPSVYGLVKGANREPVEIAFVEVRNLMARAKLGEFDIGMRPPMSAANQVRPEEIYEGRSVMLTMFNKAVRAIVASVDGDKATLEAKFNGVSWKRTVDIGAMSTVSGAVTAA